MAMSYVGNSAANLFNSFVSPVALDAIGWKYYTVYIALLVQFLIVVYLFFPETRGYKLEDIAYLFESKRIFLGHAKVGPRLNENGPPVIDGTPLKEPDVELVEDVSLRALNAKEQK